MILSSQIEPVSTEHLVMCLGFAIDEARFVRPLIQMRDLTEKLRIEWSSCDHLTYLNRENVNLEKKLVEVGELSQANWRQQ
jgi:hypothetical protein